MAAERKAKNAAHGRQAGGNNRRLLVSVRPRLVRHRERTTGGIPKPMTPLEPQPATPELDRQRFQFTLKELLVVTMIVAILLAILVPLLNVQREAARRASCLNNAREIDLAMANYASAFNYAFPPSASLAKAADGTQTVGGWSFLVRLLPLMEQEFIYKSLRTEWDPEDTSSAAIVAAMNTQPGEFLCPSGPRRRASSSQSIPGITNYKAMGATTRGSLVMVVNPQATPPYGTMTPIPGSCRCIRMVRYFRPRPTYPLPPPGRPLAYDLHH